MEREFTFEKLRVWQEARKLVRSVYQVTDEFPRREVFGLISQLNRAVVSVACNLAEGTARTSAKDQAHFTQLAYSSLMEVACLVLICTDNRFLSDQKATELRGAIQGLSAGINALHRTQISQ
jgi:four helix bundle protein